MSVQHYTRQKSQYESENPSQLLQDHWHLRNNHLSPAPLYLFSRTSCVAQIKKEKNREENHQPCIHTPFHNFPLMDALSTPVPAAFKSGCGGGGGGSNSLLLPSSPKASISLLKASSSLPLPSTTNLSFHTKPQLFRTKSRAKSHLRPSPEPKSHAPSNSATFHHRAATGYAAALADAACRAGTLAAADVDARQLVRRVRGVMFDPTMQETEKVEMVR